MTVLRTFVSRLKGRVGHRIARCGKNSARQAVFKRGEHAPYQPEPHEGHRLLRRVAEKCRIDAEYPRRVRGSAGRRASCTAAESWDIQSSPNPAARFLAYWTLKESISKCRGTGLSESFQNYEITFQNGMPHLNGYTLFFEQYGVHFLAAAEEA